MISSYHAHVPSPGRFLSRLYKLREVYSMLCLNACPGLYLEYQRRYKYSYTRLRYRGGVPTISAVFVVSSQRVPSLSSQATIHRRDQNQIAGLAREYDYMGRSLMFFWSHVDVMENSKMLPSNRITHFSGWWSRPPLPPGYGSTLLLLHMRQWSNAWLLEWSIKMKIFGRIGSFLSFYSS